MGFNKFFIIFVIATIFTLGLSFNNFANAASMDEKTRCSEGFELVYRVNADKYACVFETTSQKWQNLGIAEQLEQQLSDIVETSSVMKEEVVKVSMQEQNNDVKIEWLGWSFYRITTPGGVVILTNPWYENPDNPTSLDDIPKADIILVPTGHPDEVGNALEIAAKNNSTIVASHDLVNLVWKDKDQPRSVPVTFDGIPIKTAQFQPGTIRTIDGITIRAVTALHGNWETGGPAMGFFITMENGHVIYFSGSTDLTLDMKLWGEMFKPDTAILYTHSSMDPHEIAMMAQLLSENNPNLKTVLPLHHRINPPEGHAPADLGQAMADLGLKVELIDPQLGVVYTLSK